MATLRQPLNPLAQPFVSTNQIKTELLADYSNLLLNDASALNKIVDLNLFFLDKITQIEQNLSQRLLTDFRVRIAALEREVSFLNQENNSLKQKLAINEDATKILYLKLEGLPESDTSTLINLVCNALSRTGVNCTPADIDMVRRIGKQNSNNARPVLIRFLSQSKRDLLLFNRFNLNKNHDDSRLWLNDEVSDLTRRNRKTAKGVAFQANALGIENVRVHSDGLILGEGKFKLFDLDLLPPLLTAESAKTLQIDEDIYFQSHLSPFSNFYPSRIIDTNSIIFENIEQAFQYRKALAHNNQQLAHKIMKTRDPYEHKRLGNLVEQPSMDWKNEEEKIMTDLIHLKFTQNSSLANILISTGEKSLHEATGDSKWATGADLLSIAVRNRTWTGQDRLGQLLQQERSKLIHMSKQGNSPQATPDIDCPSPDHHDQLTPMPDDDLVDTGTDPQDQIDQQHDDHNLTCPLPDTTLPPPTSSSPPSATAPTQSNPPTCAPSLNSLPVPTPSKTPQPKLTTLPPPPVFSSPPPSLLSYSYPPPLPQVVTQQPMSPAHNPLHTGKYRRASHNISSHISVRRSTREKFRFTQS